MNKLSLFVWYLSVGVMVVTLAACRSSSKPTQEDIVGLWIEQPVKGSASSICGSFEFFEDGHFEAKNIPREYFVPPGYSTSERIDAQGSWVLDTSSNDPFAVHRIELLFSPIEGLPSSFERVLYIAVGGDLLYAGIDDSVLFKRGVCTRE